MSDKSKLTCIVASVAAVAFGGGALAVFFLCCGGLGIFGLMSTPQQEAAAPNVQEAKVAAEQKPIEDTVPPVTTLRAMATESLQDFNEAVRTQDFTAFHAKTASQLQQESTPEDFKNAFQQAIDEKWKLDGVKSVRPVFDPAPAIDKKGWLRLEGRYHTTPMEVTFTLAYLYERPGGWKLCQIKVRMEDPKK